MPATWHPKKRRHADWQRKYPPMAGFGAALFLMAVVLPSALNVPQTNPSATLEYAPVPPSDQDAPSPPAGNASSLSLGNAAGPVQGEGGGPTTDGVLDAPPPGTGARLSTKQCVGNPPRQTEDPLSPPCVAFFEGDNFGATYQGVSRDEIVLLYLLAPGCYGSSRGGCENTPSDAYFDLSQPPDENETGDYLRALRTLQRYFNDRYQTYGRTVRFIAHYAPSAVGSDEERRAQAAEAFALWNPFVVFSDQIILNPQPYLDAMVDRGALSFGSFAGRPAEMFARRPRLVWGYLPSVEQQAINYASYVCQKVIPYPVSFSGNSDHGQPRKLGFVYTTDPDWRGMQLFAQVARREIESCGGHIEAEAAVPSHSYVSDSQNPPFYAAEAIARFRSQGVTTVIWAQGYETAMSRASASSGYFPEWVVAGDGIHEGQSGGLYQTALAWSEHAWAITPVTATPPPREQRCTRAQEEVDPGAGELQYVYGCYAYNDLRQFFTGVQVAGPRLAPDSIDQGFRAIPAKASTDPTVPACFYEPGDYTCVKDGQATWWDAAAPGGGCWRMAEAGRRYLTHQWPAGDVITQRNQADSCNSYTWGARGR